MSALYGWFGVGDDQMSTTTIVATLWYCLAGNPACAPEEGVGGPPAVNTITHSIKECEAFYENFIKIYPPMEGTVPRHSCEIERGI